MSDVGVTKPSALNFFPEARSWQSLRDAARDCRGCELYKKATQTVFGEGHRPSKLLFIGEQPGDQEDRSEKPFVGPAGRLLDECMVEAGIAREAAYVTNAVKHFKWEPRGKIRLHKKPSQREITACNPWLEAEIEVTKPKLIVCLGATAAQSILGAAFRVTRSRGQVLNLSGYPALLATVHPSAILRARTEVDRTRERKAFISDLTEAARFISRSNSARG
jgi:uracil-DNA glycosylase family protein